ncbi:TetR/AcrR family transcriptional regulator, partial [Rhizobiaceae sp. 2RAB30]
MNLDTVCILNWQSRCTMNLDMREAMLSWMADRSEKKRLTRVESMALTRQKLLDTALDTFLRVGFGAATIDGISEAAGFSRGAFYANFQSKEEIFLEAISS